jgi:hypothetical protein
VIPQIAGYVRYHIKSIVDLRMPGTDDLTLNPEKIEKYRQKRMLSQKLRINYFSNPSEQFQTKKIKNFTK